MSGGNQPVDEDDIFGDDVAAPVAATVPLMNMGGGGGDLSATHSGGHLHSHQTHQNSQNSSQARQAPLRFRDEDPSPARSTFASPISSLQAKHLGTKFRSVLTMLLVLYVLLHVVDSILGIELSPIAPDMLLLFVGWYAQDLYRIQALTIYCTLSLLSLVIDLAGVVITAVFILRYGYSIWYLIIIGALFIIESAFKISSIIHGRRMLAFLKTAERTPI